MIDFTKGFSTVIQVNHFGDECVVYFAHEAREVERWTRAAEAVGETLPEWLTRLAKAAGDAWAESTYDEPDSVRPGPGDE